MYTQTFFLACDSCTFGSYAFRIDSVVYYDLDRSKLFLYPSAGGLEMRRVRGFLNTIIGIRMT